MFTKPKKSDIIVILRSTKGKESLVMKLIKNAMTILIIFCITIMILSNNVSAATANVGTSASKVTVREKCSCNSFF